MDCNFPELLARDLGAPDSAFATRKLRASAPSIFSITAVRDLLPIGETGLHLIGDPASVCIDEEGYTPAPGPEIRYFPLSHQPTLLEPIHEVAADGETHDGTSIAHHAESDWDSLSSSSHPSSSHPSSTMDIQSTRPGGASLMTTATSMASGPLPTDPANIDRITRCPSDSSWFEVDSNSEESPRADSPRAAPIYSRRRQLELGAEQDIIRNQVTDAFANVLDKPRGLTTPGLTRSSSRGENYTLQSGRVSKRWPSRRRGIIRFTSVENFLPDSPTSLPEGETGHMPAPMPEIPLYSSPTLTSQQLGGAHDMHAVDNEAFETKAMSFPLQTPIRCGSCPPEVSPFERPSTKHSSDSHREPLSSSQAPKPSNIQTWIDTSQDSAAKPDDQLPGIPLPPDVVDNLRISISCFPDTMLLTSSLSIETIRSYSRKVKACAPEPKRDLTPPPAHQPRRWGLSRILSSRRSNASSSGSGSPVSSEDAAPATPWAPLRAVFPSGSEYLCDALYAHIVAYNYISALPRCAAASPAKPSPGSADEAEVPRKAAALLGLPEADASSIETARSPPSSRQGPGEKRDGALKDLLVGLSWCIGRLVITLKEGRSEVVPEESGDVDLFLVRAMCEVVRCSEERS